MTIKEAEVVRMNAEYKEAMRKLIDRYWNLAECEPDWNQAQNYRHIAKALETIANDEEIAEASGHGSAS